MDWPPRGPRGPTALVWTFTGGPACTWAAARLFRRGAMFVLGSSGRCARVPNACEVRSCRSRRGLEMSDSFQVNDETSAVRGLVIGCVLSLPFWAAVVGVLRLLRT